MQELSTKLPDTFKYKLQVLTRDKTDKDKGSKGGLAVCAMFDPHYNRAQDFARWARWHYALGNVASRTQTPYT